MPQLNKEPYKVVNTKVSNDSFAAFQLLCKERGITPYELLQMVIDTLIRTMDRRHKVSPELQNIIDIFEGMDGWADAMSHTATSDDVRREVGEATYYMCDASGHKHGCRAILVQKPFFGQPQYTCNIYTIVERAVCLLFPALYRNIRYHAAENGFNNIVEQVRSWEHEARESLNQQTLHDEFADDDRAENSRKTTAQRFVRKHRTTINDYETLDFGPDDEA